MKVTRLKVLFAGSVVVLTLLWLLSLPPGAFTGGFWPARGALVNYAGILAIAFMALALILAARPVQIEGALTGLDKFYRLHRWFGVAAAAAAILHWLFEVAPRWLVRAGILERPQRRAPPPEAAAGFDPFRDLREVAAGIGEIGIWLLLILVILALWKRVPYRHFLKIHKVLAPLYLALVFHGVILMDRAYWTGPVGPILAIVLASGSVAAVASLFGRIGKSHRAVGEIESLEYYPENEVLDVGVRLSTAWPGHHAGQFAFVDFGGVEGAHPFTISSAWRRDGRLSFTIKGLGDYTRALPGQLFVGQAVTVEGPYGRFDFQGEGRRQIWIAGGIGITPFIAGLQALADEGRRAPVDLFYSTRAPSAPFIENIRRLAEEAGVGFHLTIEQRDGFLTLDRIEERVPDWMEADVWFCGPIGFSRAIYAAMAARGFPESRFHQELFQMR